MSVASGLSPTGRLITMPKAPSLSCLAITMTVRAKRGSPIDGDATNSWPASEPEVWAVAGGGACSTTPAIAIAAIRCVSWRKDTFLVRARSGARHNVQVVDGLGEPDRTHQRNCGRQLDGYIARS